MKSRSRKLGFGAGLTLALGMWMVGCDHGSSASKRDGSPDGAGGSGSGDLSGDQVRADGAAVGDDGARDTRVASDANDKSVVDAAGVAEVADVAEDRPTESNDIKKDDIKKDDIAVADASTSDRGLDDDATGDDGGPQRDGTSLTVDAVSDAASDSLAPAPFQLAVAPNRMLDLVFLIDNSPSMAPKQDKLRAQLPKLIQGLRDPSDGSLPDLRVAIIDSDLGTGGAYSSGYCGPKNGSNYGDQGHFQMIDASSCGVTDAQALWLEHKQGQPLNYKGDLGDVFSCLAGKLGTLGCGDEHQLQAFEFALVAQGLGNENQQKMLRPAAYLGLVFLSDEDDCSAAMNDGMFGTNPGSVDLSGEAASLRCATRAHACAGANLTATPPGYPTTAPFSAPLSTCAPRVDACPNPMDGNTTIDVSVPTACSPLRSIERMASGIKGLKSSPEQIFVAGIFGWPLADADVATATYKIGLVPNPASQDIAHPHVFDSWPVCYDPAHLPSDPEPVTGFDSTAASNGATPGLRLAAFVDAFGNNGLKFSVCQPDYSAAMAKIANALSKKMQNLCLPAVYVQRSCPARYLRPDGNGGLIPDATTLPECNAQHSNEPCYALSTNPGLCPGDARVVSPVWPSDGGVGDLPYGTVLEFRCP